MRIAGAISVAMWRQQGHLLTWVPVFLGIGIGTYFQMRSEPTVPVYGALAALIVAGGVLAQVLPFHLRSLVTAAILVATGFSLAGWRAHQMTAPVLEYRYYGPVQGRIVGIDRSASDKVRLTLDQVVLLNHGAQETPERVRVSLHGKFDTIDPVPGLPILLTANLSPPQGPVEPGGFDFQRHSWFLQLGGVGYTRTPVLATGPPQRGTVSDLILAARLRISRAVQAALPGEVGAFAAAVTTGDRAAMSKETLEDLRASNLAHLLAISGLHMGLLTGFVLAAARAVLALVPYTALHWPTRRIAACVALVFATGYLALSGGNVATERAYVMAAVALTALILNRRAITLRAVAIAAIIVLFLRPEALMGPGFQMSFAATAGLVAAFNWIRDKGVMQRLPGWLRPVAALVISSAVAGAATAPFGAAHFNQIAHYGLLANLASVPVMGILVMPAAVIALILSAVGLGWAGLWLMGVGLSWILGVADWVSGLEGAVSYVPDPPTAMLPLLTLGALVLIVWKGRERVVGLLPVLASVILWYGAERPDVLIADSGALIGVMTDEGRALSRPKGAGFVAQNWLENDGDGVDQATAAERLNASGATDVKLEYAGAVFRLLRGKKAVAGFDGCAAGEIVVANVAFAPGARPDRCTVFDPKALARSGSVAYFRTAQGWKKTTAREISGRRLWNARGRQ